jgi:hypothetical protein
LGDEWDEREASFSKVLNFGKAEAITAMHNRIFKIIYHK